MVKQSVRPAALAALACATLWSATAFGQVYRIIGPDGRVTFSDRPPADAKAVPAQALAIAGGGGSATSTLPYELRNAASRYPVTLYTGPECGPCGDARNFLNGRGVPFTEHTVSSPQDIDALKRLAGQAVLPFATIGGQHLVGFAESAWGQYLDAAGYPRSSQLPPNWRNPTPTPVVAVSTQPAAPARAAQAAPAPRAANAPEPPVTSPSNPAGIRF
jgi:glutaredoxin